MPSLDGWLAGSEALLACSEAWQAGSEACLAGSEACLAGSWALEGGTDVRMDVDTYVRTYGQMDGWKISPFYRTLSPIGAAAPLQSNFNPKTI